MQAGQTPEDDGDRWEKEIQNLETKFRSDRSQEGGILFVGSSSIRLWNLKESFPDADTVNHGFGGSVLADSVQFFDRIVIPVKPRAIILYAGDNDIAQGKSPETVLHDFQQFHKRTREAFPNAPVYFLSIKPSLKRWTLRDQMQTANRKIAEFCKTGEKAVFVDVWSVMLQEDGTPRPQLFAEDGLHLNSAGYALWTEVLTKQFRDDLLLPAKPDENP